MYRFKVSDPAESAKVEGRLVLIKIKELFQNL
jgi:hypothetical protein